jgi:hypothetical protein
MFYRVNVPVVGQVFYSWPEHPHQRVVVFAKVVNVTHSQKPSEYQSCLNLVNQRKQADKVLDFLRKPSCD